jgi:hypothetical protein
MVVSAAKIRKYVKGVRYPATKRDLIQKAQEQGADQSIILTLEKYPDKKYQSAVDLMMEYSETVRV